MGNIYLTCARTEFRFNMSLDIVAGSFMIVSEVLQ